MNEHNLYRRICPPTAPHRNVKMGGDCSTHCFVPAEIIKELQWCKRHNAYASFTGSRGLTCMWPGQEECWCVPCGVVMLEDDE